ncbi:MAG: aspartate aminotransferase family protein [Nocardioides sp.]|nr:aspartate aminotransferase family protein [Nocardioides sp.]
MSPFENWESEIRGYCRAYPTVFSHASNARQVDEDGTSYIDFFGGAGVLNFGHNNPKMKQAMIDFLQADGVAHSLDTYTTTKRDFINRFHEVVLEPRGMDHKMQFMGPTGSNAVEAALKLARISTGRRQVVAFSHGFHGMTLGSLAATGNEAFRKWAGVPLEHVFRLPHEHAVGGDTALDGYRAALEDASSGVEPPAAFIVEVLQAEGGVWDHSKEWLHAVQQLARDHGALFIIDDIQSACGRTGSYFSFDGMGLDPDIITLAKGLGGFGTPIAMNLNKPEVDAHWAPGAHTGTFRGQGLSFVAGTVALDYFAEGATLMDEVAIKGEQMAQRLKAIADAHPDRGWEVRGRGMMQALDMGDGALAKEVQNQAFASGLLIGPCGTGGRVVKLIPPLTIPQEDLDEGLDLLEKAIAGACAQQDSGGGS